MICSLRIYLCVNGSDLPNMFQQRIGFDDAVQNAIAETAQTVKDIRRWADITSLKVIVSGDKITEYQALMRVAFKVKR
jgi:flavin-binding protein dodecin